MIKNQLQETISTIINDINTNGKPTHPKGETTTPIIIELIGYNGKINTEVDRLINEFLNIQLFAKNKGIPVLKEILTIIK